MPPKPEYTIRQFILDFQQLDLAQNSLKRLQDGKPDKQALQKIFNELIIKSRHSAKTTALVEFLELIKGNAGDDQINAIALLLEEVIMASKKSVVEAYCNQPCFTYIRFRDIKQPEYTIRQFILDFQQWPNVFAEIEESKSEAHQDYKKIIDALIEESQSFAKIRILKAFLALIDLGDEVFKEKIKAIELLQAEVNVAKKRGDLAVCLDKGFTQLPLQNISTKTIASFKPTDSPSDNDEDNKPLPEEKPLSGKNLADYCRKLSDAVAKKLEEIEQATHNTSATPKSPTGTGLSPTATCNLL